MKLSRPQPEKPANRRVRRIRGLRTLLALIALGVALALAGCGGDSDQSSQMRLIPRGLAADLAEKSDAVAAAIEAGDVCGAAGLADELKNAVDDAIDAGRIPPTLQDGLVQTATDLQNEVNCPVQTKPEEKKKGEDKGEGKKKGHEDETTTGVTIETTTGEG
jgi:hypothetical protein